MISPRIQFLETKTIERVIEEAYQLLIDPGVLFNTDRPVHLLADAGADVDFDKKLARIPALLIDQARKTCPDEIIIYDQPGNPSMNLGGDNSYYYPASTAMTIWDAATNTLKPPVTADMLKYIKVVEGLPNCDAQSSTLYCHDVPGEVVDTYRNYLLLKYATKPFVTGAYSIEGQELELEIMAAFRGGKEALAEKPMVVMTACPSPPLKWSFTADNVIICAEAMIPMGIGPMPLSGGTGPVTLIGTIVQHTAEFLSGLVLAQLARPCAPILSMCPTSIFDMQQGTTPLGAIETHMICCGTNEVAKYLGVPSLVYMGISDSKMADAQQAMETTAGILLNALNRANLNGCLGMIDFESGQSFEALVISHEAVGMARRLIAGINDQMTSLGLDVIRQVGHSGNFLETMHTAEWFKKELYFPDIIDRCQADKWRKAGAKNMVQRATERVAELESSYEQPEKPEDVIKEIETIMQRAMSKYGMHTLPA